MLNIDLSKRLTNLGINAENKSNVIRLELEDLLDEAAVERYVDTTTSSKYQIVEQVYSEFMEEYTKQLDEVK